MNHVLIIGGGIGGLCLAQGLTRAGVRTTVFDRDVDASLRDQGWRVTLKEDGVAALRDCLPTPLFELCQATALLPPTRLAVTDHLLRPMFVKPVPATGGFGMNRLTLREILRTGLDVSFNNLNGPDGVSFGVSRCRTAEPVGQAAARLAPEASLTDIPDYLAWTIRGWPEGATPRESVREFHPAVHRIVDATEETVTIRLRAAKPVKPWHTNNVTLLGDAVHTMPPGRGEGANTALRDAVLLRDLLVAEPLATAKARYEAEMLDYGFRVVAQSVQEPFFRRIAQGG